MASAGACVLATSRPLRSLLVAVYVSGGSAVALYLTSAVASGFMHVKWRRLSKRDRDCVWPMYGAFTLLMACGSLVGVAAWLCYMQSVALFFIANDSLLGALNVSQSAERLQLFASSTRWGAAHRVFYPVEFMCISVTKLLAVDRVFAISPSDADSAIHRLKQASMLVLVSVVSGNLIGICGGIAAAVLSGQSADSTMHAAGALLENNELDAIMFVNASLKFTQLSDKAASVQSFSEVTVLLLIMTILSAAAIVFAFYTRASLQDLKLAADGDAEAISRVDEFSGMRSEAESRKLAAEAGSRSWKLGRQVLGTAAFIFATFLLRTIAITAYAVARALQNEGVQCSSQNLCDTECYNSYALFLAWNFYTPEFQIAIVIISAPIALLVALWGMTSQNILKLMTNKSSVSLPLQESTQKKYPRS